MNQFVFSIVVAGALLWICLPGASQGQKKGPPKQDVFVGRLLEELTNTKNSLEKRVLAAEALGKQGPKAKATIPAIAALLEETTKSPDEARNNAQATLRLITVLVSFGSDSEPAVPALAKAAKVTNISFRGKTDYLETVNRTAITALGKVATERATVELTELIRKDTIPHRRVAAMVVLGEVALGDAKAREKILLELQVWAATDEVREVREAAEKNIADLKKLSPSKK